MTIYKSNITKENILVMYSVVKCRYDYKDMIDIYIYI